MTKTMLKAPKYLLGLLLFGVMSMFIFSHQVSAKPFFKCEPPLRLSFEGASGGNQTPNYFCVKADGSAARRSPAMAIAPNNGYFNARARCPAGKAPYAELDGVIYWVYCAAETGPVGGHAAAGSVPPTSFETPPPTTGPSGGGGGGGGAGGGGSSSFDNPDRARAINCSSPADCVRKNPITKLLKKSIKFFAVVIGVIVTLVIIWAGFTYAHAGGDPSKTAEAKNRIKNAIIALAVFIFLAAGMTWAIPGA